MAGTSCTEPAFFTVVTVPNSLVKVACAGVTALPSWVAAMVTVTRSPAWKVSNFSMAFSRAVRRGAAAALVAA